LNNKYIKKLQL